MISSALQINNALQGFTDVMEVCLTVDPASSSYQLKLALENSEGKTIRLACSDVSNFSLSGFGGGLSQFMYLRAEDVRDRQLDRVAFHFADLEHHAIAFDCSSAHIEAEEQAALLAQPTDHTHH